MAEWFVKRTIGSLVDERRSRDGGREALLFEGRRWTFAELAADVDAVARGLIECGVAPGEKVALWMMNRAEWIHAALAIMRIGAVLVPINTRFRTEDAAYVLRQSDAATLIIAAQSGAIDYLGMVRAMLPSLGSGMGVVNSPNLPALQRVMALDEAALPGIVAWPALLARGARIGDDDLRARIAAVDPDATAFIIYTSGTTGFPKGVMHCHNIIRNVVDRAFRMAITPADTILMYLPLYHLFGFSEGLLMSMATGARQLLTHTFDADESLSLLEREKATILHGFDTHFKDLLEAFRRCPRDVGSTRTGILAAGMPSSIPIAREARRVLGPFLSGYGMSEIGAGVALSALDSSAEQCTAASGYPAPGYEIRIVDPVTGSEQPAGTAGEILVRGYTLMQGYYRKPDETAQAIDAQGWLHTGDMGMIRSDGHLCFLGRYKDMLKIGGENVDPLEVEAFVATHPAVATVAVVGLPDARLGEVPVAFVCPKPNRELTLSEMADFCRGKIASYKIPRHVLCVEALPMTGSGKVQKATLREEARRRYGSQ